MNDKETQLEAHGQGKSERGLSWSPGPLRFVLSMGSTVVILFAFPSFLKLDFNLGAWFSHHLRAGPFPSAGYWGARHDPSPASHGTSSAQLRVHSGGHLFPACKHGGCQT